MATTANTTTDTGAAVPGFAAPAVDAVKALAKKSPWATATLAVIVGIAALNTLRGK